VTRTKVVLLLGCLLVLGAAAAGAFWVGLRSLDQPLKLAAPIRYRVPAGASFARVAGELGSLGIVAQPRAWVLFARWKALASGIKAGEYEIEPGTTPRRLLDKFVGGQVLLHSFTIIDGWRVHDLLTALRRSPDIIATLPDPPVNLMELIGAPGIHPEGQFLPETYRFPGGTTDVELLRLAHSALSRVLDAAWQDRDPSQPLENPDELLILASIVEKESAQPAELGKIAGLYLHRLSIGMRLQADPTIIYGLGLDYDGDLRSVDLRTDGPYNTYTRSGLPPTPIALAGAAAIRASARPEKTDAIFFVASGKGDGSHVFSSTLQEHNAAVAQYLARQHVRSAAGAAQ
jgi:UPF0755 protein